MVVPGDGDPLSSGGTEGVRADASAPGRRPEPAAGPGLPRDGNNDGVPAGIDLSLRPPRFPVSLEKWYIDVLLDDGTVCLVYIGTLVLCGKRFNRVTAELFRPGAATVRGSARVGALVGGLGFLRSAAASIEGGRLRFKTDGLSGDLLYRPRSAPWRLAAPFLSVGRRALTWSVEIPDADVEGRLEWPGGSLEVRGRGYRDRVWFDLVPWRFPISRLAWGRAIAGPHAAVWTQATTARGVVAGAWMDGREVDFAQGAAVPVGIDLGPPRVILDSDVADLEGLRLGLLRRPVGWLSGAPHETKWQAPCAIADDPGVAIHEVVTWRAAGG